MIKNKKAQGWSLDIVVAGVIFLTGVITLYVYAINYSSQSQKQIDEMFYEGNLAAELILSDEDFGILSENKINQTKLDDFHNNYDDRKNTLGVTRNFYFIIDDLELNSAPAEYAGRMNATETESNIKVTRIVIYKDKPTKFDLYIWE
jgi:hypothetical protein